MFRVIWKAGKGVWGGVISEVLTVPIRGEYAVIQRRPGGF